MRRFFGLWSSSSDNGGSDGGSVMQPTTSDGGITSTNGIKTTTLVDLEVKDDDMDNITNSFDANFASDPCEWQRAFDEEWRHLRRALQQPIKVVRDVRHFFSFMLVIKCRLQVTQVCKHLDTMSKLLVLEVNLFYYNSTSKYIALG